MQKPLPRQLHQNLGSKVRFVGIALDGKRSAEKFIDKPKLIGFHVKTYFKFIFIKHLI
ncbi:hypothetical protein GCD22_02012 [Acidithiobacillus thiooxidans ATCC 19377]|uniref:Uncharacterized protein n=1 Tax=Acidithiobacillus thiooxidans ATCC 19377 TaxID=637390 RepID=A0A5P9XQC1_ACITH|nr:hypothetical protein GCD22_02012 [Acidithiobacillus thiooxidans ATCC 19377]